MSRNCDNPDCENLVPNLPSHHIRMGNSVFCSTKCKEEFFLWVVAVARRKSRDRRSGSQLGEARGVAWQSSAVGPRTSTATACAEQPASFDDGHGMTVTRQPQPAIPRPR